MNKDNYHEQRNIIILLLLPLGHISNKHCLLPLARRRSSCMPGAQASRASSSLPAWPPRSFGRRHAPPWTALTLPMLIPSSGSLPLSSPSAAVAANQRSRGHSHPRAAPSYPRAPPPRSLPPHRATRPEGPRSAAPMLFSSSAAGDPPRRPARSDASPSSPFTSSQPP